MKLEDVWENYEVSESGCWIWNRSRNTQGYGKLRVFIDGKSSFKLAHRVAWELANNETIPPGLVVLHSCDRPPCICPAHLSVGSYKENNEDMVRKGRWRGGGLRGELHSNAVLTGRQVLEARELRANGDISYTELGRVFGVSKQAMRAAVIGASWRHL